MPRGTAAGRPVHSSYLPAHGVFIVAQIVRKLDYLLGFFEEHLHAQVELVKLAGGEGRPFQVVGDECHLHHLPLDFNLGCHQSQFFRIMFPGVDSGQPDAFIGQDTAFLPDISTSA